MRIVCVIHCNAYGPSRMKKKKNVKRSMGWRKKETRYDYNETNATLLRAYSYLRTVSIQYARRSSSAYSAGDPCLRKSERVLSGLHHADVLSSRNAWTWPRRAFIFFFCIGLARIDPMTQPCIIWRTEERRGRETDKETYAPLYGM